MTAPLITLALQQKLRTAMSAGLGSMQCSLDLDRSTTSVKLAADGWHWQGQQYPWLEACKARTIYYWTGAGFEPVARYSGSLIKLVPTEWGPPTFEIDGIKMLPTAQVSPYADAARKVALIQPRGARVLDTCGGLGYFAACCLEGDAAHVHSFEKNEDVIWLRSLNPWSPLEGGALTLTHGDVIAKLDHLADQSFDAILHDPPRFGIAGELYSQACYDQFSRLLRRGGRMFHYTGTPNRLTSGRDVPNEVAKRLKRAGFATELNGDGVLAIRR